MSLKTKVKPLSRRPGQVRGPPLGDSIPPSIKPPSKVELVVDNDRTVASAAMFERLLAGTAEKERAASDRAAKKAFDRNARFEAKYEREKRQQQEGALSTANDLLHGRGHSPARGISPIGPDEERAISSSEEQYEDRAISSPISSEDRIISSPEEDSETSRRRRRHQVCDDEEYPTTQAVLKPHASRPSATHAQAAAGMITITQEAYEIF